MRKAGIVAAIIIGVLVVLALVVPAFVDINRYHDRIQAQIEQQIHRPVQLGTLHLWLLPPSVRVDDVVIAEDRNFATGRPFASVSRLYVKPQILPLLHGEVALRSIILDRPQIELVRSQQGIWNFSTLSSTQPAAPSNVPPPPNGPAPAQKAPAQQPANAPQSSSSSSFSIGNLTINDGEVAITDWQKHQPRAIYDHIDLDLNDFAPNQAVNATLTAHLPGPGAERIELQGQAGPIQQSNPAAIPFDGKLRLNHVALSSVQKFLNSPALQGMEAIASGEAQVKSAGAKLSSEGSLNLNDVRVHNVSIGYPITADYRLSDDLNSDLLQIDKGEVKLGPTPLSLTGRIHLQPTPAQLDAHLTASNASLAELARLAGAFGVAFNPNTQVRGTVNADIRAQGAMTKPALNGTLVGRDLAISGKEMPQPVRVGSLDLALTPQVIRSQPFKAESGNTKLSGSFTLSNYTSPAPQINASLRTVNANVGELLDIARAYGVSAVEGMSGSGALSLDVNVTGTTSNLNSLNFNGNGSLQNASLKMPSLTEPLNIQNAVLRFTQNSAVVQNIALSVANTNASGNLSVRNFAAPQLQFDLNADKIDVAQWQRLTGSTTTPRPAAASASLLLPLAEAAPVNQSPVANITGGGMLNVGTIIYDQLLMNNARAKATFSHGVVQLAPVTAQLFGGQENGTISIDTRTTPMRFNVISNLQRVDANKLLSSMSSVKGILYGLLATNAQASFASNGSNDIMRTLNGKLALDLRNGKLANVDLLQQLASVGKFLNAGHTPKGFTDLVQLTGNFDVSDGVATTNNLRAVIDGGTLAAAGAVNLVNNSLNMHLTAVLNKAMSSTVGGSQIGGFMNTALANNKGELVVPVLVTGTFQSPQFAPDLQEVANMKLHNLLPSTSNPGQLTTGLVGAILGNKNQAGGQNARSGIAGVLGRITGQQQQQQQPAAGAPANGQTQAQPGTNNNGGGSLGGLLNSIGSEVKKQKQQQQNPPAQQQNPPPQQQTQPANPPH